MELRQLRYFTTLADELHFGRAAAREHIVQSALSQQVSRLERELGVRLFERTTHGVWLTPAGSALLAEARAVLDQAHRAALAAQRATPPAPQLRVGIVDASHASMPRILQDFERRYPSLAVHEVETGSPEQIRLLADGQLDVGIGRAALAPPEVASELVRLDTLGVVVPDIHRFAVWPAVPVAALAGEPLLLAEKQRAPEYGELNELCRSAGFVPKLCRGTVESVLAAINRVTRGRCVLCAPASCVFAAPGVVWRPLVEPVFRYPWSLMWRNGDDSEFVHGLVSCALTLSRDLGWLDPGLLPAEV